MSERAVDIAEAILQSLKGHTATGMQRAEVRRVLQLLMDPKMLCAVAACGQAYAAAYSWLCGLLIDLLAGEDLR